MSPNMIFRYVTETHKEFEWHVFQWNGISSLAAIVRVVVWLGKGKLQPAAAFCIFEFGPDFIDEDIVRLVREEHLDRNMVSCKSERYVRFFMSRYLVVILQKG